jgi:hypothetical protein
MIKISKALRVLKKVANVWAGIQEQESVQGFQSNHEIWEECKVHGYYDRRVDLTCPKCEKK